MMPFSTSKCVISGDRTLLNDGGDDADQLPVMQHALMRIWEKWQNNSHGSLDLEHYNSWFAQMGRYF